MSRLTLFVAACTLIKVVLCGETSQVSSWSNGEGGGVAQGIPGVFSPANGRGVPGFLSGNNNMRLGGGEGASAFQSIPNGPLPGLGSLLSGGDGTSTGGAYAGGSQREAGGEGESYGKNMGATFGKPMGEEMGKPFGNMGESLGKPFGGIGEAGMQRPFAGSSRHGEADFGFLLGMGRGKRPETFGPQESGAKGGENGESAYGGGERNGRTERDPQSTYGESGRGEKMPYQKPSGYGESSGGGGGSGYGYGESASHSKRGIGEFFSNLMDLGHGYAYGDAPRITGLWFLVIPAAVGLLATAF